LKIIIVGGGKVGRYLLTNMMEKNHDIVLIEQNEAKCQRIKDNHNIEVVCGDGSRGEILEQAGIEEADVLLAVTKDDQDNLVICQLAERKFNVPRTLTTVNTPGNERLFDWLGVNVAVSSPAILSALVEQEVKKADLDLLFSPKHDDLKLIRINVSDEAEVIGSKLKDIELPQEAVLVSILRGDTPIVPRGNTKILAEDFIIALIRRGYQEELTKIFSH